MSTKSESSNTPTKNSKTHSKKTIAETPTQAQSNIYSSQNSTAITSPSTSSNNKRTLQVTLLARWMNQAPCDGPWNTWDTYGHTEHWVFYEDEISLDGEGEKWSLDGNAGSVAGYDNVRC